MMELGERFRVGIFGSSHGPEVGLTIDGIPPGTVIDPAGIQVVLFQTPGREASEEDHP